MVISNEPELPFFGEEGGMDPVEGAEAKLEPEAVPFSDIWANAVKVVEVEEPVHEELRLEKGETFSSENMLEAQVAVL